MSLSSYDHPKVVLLGLDSSHSPTFKLSSSCHLRAGYTPFGHSQVEGTGYTGQFKEVGTKGYFLGEGYRNYSPSILRFNAPDTYSPFGAGGVNAYAYCGAEPVNRLDPSGHFWKAAFRYLFRRSKYKIKTQGGGVIELSYKPPKTFSKTRDQFVTSSRTGRRNAFAVIDDPWVPFYKDEQRIALRRPRNLTSSEKRLWDIPFTEKVRERRGAIVPDSMSYHDAALVAPAPVGRVLHASDEFMDAYTASFISAERKSRLPANA